MVHNKVAVDVVVVVVVVDVVMVAFVIAIFVEVREEIMRRGIIFKGKLVL